MPNLCSAINGPPFFKLYDIFEYLKSACHDKQNGGQSLTPELKITVGHQPISNHNYSFPSTCKHIQPFSGYLIGHPLTLQAAATVV